MTLATLLKQPFPYNGRWQSRLGLAIYFGAFVFGFLLLVRPFELDHASTRNLFFYASLYGAVCFGAVLTATLLIPMLSPAFFTEEKWTTGKQISFVVLVIFFVGLANYFASAAMRESGWGWGNALYFQGITLALSLPPVFLLTLVRQGQLVRRYQDKASGLEQKLQAKLASLEAVARAQQQEIPVASVEAPAPPAMITICGDYQNESLTVAVDKLYLVQSANNYIKVYFEEKGKVVYVIIRLTLTKAEALLETHTAFFRCHRTSLLNLDKVSHVEGNAQGYKATLPGIEESVPVSRNLSTEFTDRLLAVRKESSLTV